MDYSEENRDGWTLALKGMPGFDMAMKRVYARYECEIIFIKEIQARGVPVIVDLNKKELDEFIDLMDPEGLFLRVATEDEEEELALLKAVEKWA